MKAKLPPYLITVLEDQHNRLNELDMLIDDLKKQLISVARQMRIRSPTGVAIVAIAVHDRNYDKNHVSIRPY